MKKILILFAALSISWLSLQASVKDYSVELLEQDANHVRIKFILNDYQLLNQAEINNQMHQILHSNGGFSSLQAGNPDLLNFTTNIQLPSRGSSKVILVNSSYNDVLNVNIIPSKGSLKRNIDPSSIPYVKGSVYGENKFYPSTVSALGNPYIHRSVRGQNVVFHPFQYHPINKTLRVYESIVVDVFFDKKKTGQNEIQNKLNEIPSSINKLNNRRYINYQSQKYVSLGETGKMLVVYYDAFESELANWKEWKVRSGFDVEMVPISSIGNNQSSIYSYVKNYYQNNPDFLFLVLVGDHQQVACYNAGNTNSEIKWSDSKYGLIDGNDWYPELYVGRFSASNTSDLRNEIDRNMEYEVSPVLSNHYNKAIGLGSNEGQGIGHMGEADWQHLRNIRTDLLNYGFSQVHEFYDGSQGGSDASGNPNSLMINNAVNNGITLFNYTGHGDLNTCITGNYSSSNINSATNNGKYPFVISVACNNGTFTTGTCLAEAWQRASSLGSPTGSIAVAASSILMAWAPPMATQDEIVDILTEKYPSNQLKTLGGLFYSGQMYMLDSYNSSNTAKEVIETWVFFGDPSVMIRSDIPSDIVVNHDTLKYTGLTELSIGCDVENAVVTLFLRDSLIGKSIVLNGQVDFTFDSILTVDSLDIIVSAYNKIPYFGKVSIIEEPIPDPIGNSTEITMYPNPIENRDLNIFFVLENDQSMAFNIYNQLGQLIFSPEYDLSEGGNELTFNLDFLSSGLYVLSTELNGEKTFNQFFIP